MRISDWSSDVCSSDLTVTDLDGEPIHAVELEAEETRRKCNICNAALWTLMRPRTLSGSDQSSAVLRALKRIPTIGEATAQKLMKMFGDSFQIGRASCRERVCQYV